MNDTTAAYLRYVWKSVVAFLALLATNVAYALVQSGQPWPATGKEWGVFAITTLGGTWLVYQKGNGPKPVATRTT